MAVIVNRALRGEMIHEGNWDDWNVWQIISVTKFCVCVSSIHFSLPLMSRLNVRSLSFSLRPDVETCSLPFLRLARARWVIYFSITCYNGSHCAVHILGTSSIHPSIYPSILFRLSEAGSPGQQVPFRREGAASLLRKSELLTLSLRLSPATLRR